MKELIHTWSCIRRVKAKVYVMLLYSIVLGILPHSHLTFWDSDIVWSTPSNNCNKIVDGRCWSNKLNVYLHVTLLKRYREVFKTWLSQAKIETLSWYDTFTKHTKHHLNVLSMFVFIALLSLLSLLSFCLYVTILRRIN